MMKKWASFLVIVISLLLSFVVIDQYIFGSKYYFYTKSSFAGDSLYNPYQDLNLRKSNIANFHAHPKNGMLNGKGNPEDIRKQYKKIGVDIAGVSQYNRLEKSVIDNDDSIFIYEHGFNFGKTHQLVIGARNVITKDYLFFQTIHNKQEILEKIASDTQNVIALTHPDLSYGYNKDDIKYLHYYDLMEVLSPYANSISYWDTALSNGRPIFAIGNDDAHDVFDRNELGRFVNIVFCDAPVTNPIMNALRKGQSAVVWLKQMTNESVEQKLKKINYAKTILSSIQTNQDTIRLKFRKTIDKLDVMVDNGLLYRSLSKDSSFTVKILPEHSYIRFEASLTDGSKVILNPIFRTNRNGLYSRNELAELHVSRNPYNPFQDMLFIFSAIAFTQLLVKLNTWFRKRRRRKDFIFNNLHKY
jgi:hypothetical protein